MVTQWFAIGLILGQLSGPVPKDKVSTVELQAIAKNALATVETMRSQRLSNPLKMGVKSRPQILKFIQSRLRDEYGPARVEAEGWLLQDQGLLPKGLNYGELVTNLLTEQVAGFYDHKRKELHIADWLPRLVQAPVMAHEIFHAIQDQEWGAGKLLDSKKFSHDQILAHAALLEGDATIVMLNFSQAALGVDVSTSAMTINLVAASLPMQMSSPQFPTMASAPAYLKQSLIFPYQQGLLFVAALRQSGLSWAKTREVYARPPSSTEQILHPKKYYKELDEPSSVEFPTPLLPGFKVRWSGVAGEFHLRQLLLSSLSIAEAAKGADGWDGDLTVVLWNGQERVSVTHSVWDNESHARGFEKALRKVEATRKKKTETAGQLYSEPVISVSGAQVTFAYSTNQQLAKQALRAAQDRAKVIRK